MVRNKSKAARIIGTSQIRVINKLLREHYNFFIGYSNNRRVKLSVEVPVEERKYSAYEADFVGIVDDWKLLEVLEGGYVRGNFNGSNGWTESKHVRRISKEHLEIIKQQVMLGKLSV